MLLEVRDRIFSGLAIVEGFFLRLLCILGTRKLLYRLLLCEMLLFLLGFTDVVFHSVARIDGDGRLIVGYNIYQRKHQQGQKHPPNERETQ